VVVTLPCKLAKLPVYVGRYVATSALEYPAGNPVSWLPLPIKYALVILPLTLSELNVPTLVILGCAFVVTVPAVVAVAAVPADVANVALATVPVTLAPGNELRAEPDPLNDAAETAPVTARLPPLTLPV
jgi:hypothetical protein